MYLVRAGRRVFNLVYMILAEEEEPAEGGPEGPGIVVTLVSGREVPLEGAEAAAFRLGLAGALAAGAAGSGAPPGTAARPGGVAVASDLGTEGDAPEPRPPGGQGE